MAFYRIAQEALNNVAKHSGAATATVSLSLLDEPRGGLRLVIQDDGTGFDPAAADDRTAWPGHHEGAGRSDRGEPDYHLRAGPGGHRVGPVVA